MLVFRAADVHLPPSVSPDAFMTRLQENGAQGVTQYVAKWAVPPTACTGFGRRPAEVSHVGVVHFLAQRVPDATNDALIEEPVFDFDVGLAWKLRAVFDSLVTPDIAHRDFCAQIRPRVIDHDENHNESNDDDA